MSCRDEEFFDVVDEADQVVEQRSRTDVHRLKLPHRAIHVFVFRSGGPLLIHLRSEDKAEFPGVWTSSASGHVSAGETYDAAARRELFEELGIRAPLESLNRFDACPDTSLEFTKLYRCVWDGSVNPDPGEIQTVRWCDPVELKARLQESPQEFSPAFRLLFGWYCEHVHDSGLPPFHSDADQVC